MTNTAAQMDGFADYARMLEITTKVGRRYGSLYFPDEKTVCGHDSCPEHIVQFIELTAALAIKAERERRKDTACYVAAILEYQDEIP